MKKLSRLIFLFNILCGVLPAAYVDRLCDEDSVFPSKVDVITSGAVGAAALARTSLGCGILSLGAKYVNPKEKLPESVEISMTPAKDQNTSGFCVAFAYAAAIESKLGFPISEADLIFRAKALNSQKYSDGASFLDYLSVLENGVLRAEDFYSYEVVSRFVEKDKKGQVDHYLRLDPFRHTPEEMKQRAETVRAKKFQYKSPFNPVDNFIEVCDASSETKLPWIMGFRPWGREERQSADPLVYASLGWHDNEKYESYLHTALKGRERQFIPRNTLDDRELHYFYVTLGVKHAMLATERYHQMRGRYKVVNFNTFSAEEIIYKLKAVLSQTTPVPIAVRTFAQYEDEKVKVSWLAYTVWRQKGGKRSPIVVSQPTEEFKKYGAHAICLCGYDDKIGAFKFKNSWGPEFGDNGFAWISYDYVKRHGLEAALLVE